jgi:hypothetical protein
MNRSCRSVVDNVREDRSNYRAASGIGEANEPLLADYLQLQEA